MPLTRRQLLAQFPHASEAFLRENSVECCSAPIPKPKRVLEAVLAQERPVYEAIPDRPLPHAISECHQEQPLGNPVQGKEEGDGRTIIRFTGFRVRPLDPDNFAGSVKDLLDGIRHAGLISGDEPWKIILQTNQVKVRSFKEEKTLVEIEYP